MDKHKILISDDDRYWRESIFPDLLATSGFQILTASTLDETLALLDRHFFHIIVVDLCLDPSDESNRDGIQTLRRAKSLGEGTRSIVLTGHGTAALARDTLVEYGAHDFLEKASLARGTARTRTLCRIE